MINNNIILEKVNNLEEYLYETRGYLHENPEVTAHEFETSKFLKGEVEKLGLSIEEVPGTGFIATLDTGKPGKTVAIRADIDALAMPESEDNLKGKKKYVSKNEGVCHSCGHDAHMSMALTSAKILTDLKDKLTGKVLFLFEEGEEAGTGIEAMLAAVKDKGIDGVWGIHVTSFMPSGTINVEPGPRMSGVSGIAFDIIGRGGHGSRPDLSINPVFAAANVLTALGSAWSNRLDVEETVTLGITMINGGTARNIIPDRVNIGGSLRFFNMEEGQKAIDVLMHTVEHTAKAHYCDVEFIYDTPVNFTMQNPVVNNEEMSLLAEEALKDILPEGAVTRGTKWYASESFGRYSQVAPIVLAFLGVQNEETGSGAEHHNVHFDIDEEAMKIGVISTVKFVNDFLGK
ncbi:MAG: amidohydrolase [Tissierellia bacterium]|jgi:amidohydrolase|nr:amidohydrolase [Tissierellia bacterium]